jgi:hypothetical protein
VVGAARREPRIALCEHDLGTRQPAWSGRFDVVRAANILNLDYFAPATLAAMSATLAGYVAEGGWFVVCRTHPDGANHATLFRREAGRLRAEARIGRGSEIEALATQPPDPSPCAS